MQKKKFWSKRKGEIIIKDDFSILFSLEKIKIKQDGLSKKR
jgi:hypothetical protein